VKPLGTISKPLPDAAADAVQIATWPGDRPGIMHVMKCRLLHRADWQYLETRHDETIAPWPVDSYHCDRCNRSWHKVN
jgi:hypothetical protein